MLGLARRHRAKILQASTSEVYGDPEIHPQTETYNGNVNLIGPRSCYDEGKRCAETLFSDYNREHSINTKIVRIFNTYGPNISFNDGRVISNFVIQALKNEEITIYGDGLQTRSFMYIDDLIDGLIKVMNTDNNFIFPVNLGNPNEITIKELADLIISLTGSKSEIAYRKKPDGDPIRRKPEISKAINELNWNPKINLIGGLKKTINYFENILKWVKELYLRAD